MRYAATSAKLIYLAAIVACSLWINLGTSGLRADDDVKASSPSNKPGVIRSNYLERQRDNVQCGLYSMLAALRALGMEPDAAHLMDQRYISSSKGSTANDLKRAAEAMGAVGTPMQSMTIDALTLAARPVILHLRKPGAVYAYEHWVTYLGDDHGRAIIFDVNDGISRVSYASLASIWDGNGIIVSRGNWAPARAIIGSRVWLFATVFLPLLGGVAVWGLISDRGAPSNSRAGISIKHPFDFEHSPACLVVKMVAILFLAVCWSFVYHSVAPRGFLGNLETARSAAAGALPSGNYATVSTDRVLAHVQTNDAQLIDARSPRGFSVAHIPGALNVPIDIAPKQWDSISKKLDKNELIVIYCQSKRCGWSAMVADWLYERGYERIRIYPAGFEAWRKAGLQVESRSSTE